MIININIPSKNSYKKVIKYLADLKQQNYIIMATIQELKNKLSFLQETLDIEQDQIRQVIESLMQTNASLQAIIDSGSIGSAEDLQQISDQIDAITADLASTISETTTTTTLPEETTTTLPPEEQIP